MVEVMDVVKSYAGRIALDQVSLSIKQGEFVAILGPSGSGKTTLLNLMGGLIPVDQGRVLVDGMDLGQLTDSELSNFRNQRVAFVFQFFNLLDHLSALENVLLPSFFSRTPERRHPLVMRARDALARVGLADRANERVSTLSGGQRQRVAVARALFSRAPLLLADEPTGNLDASSGGEVILLLKRVVEQEGVTLVAVTHEERVARAASRLVRLDGGTLVSD